MEDYKFLTFLRIAAFAIVVAGVAVFAVVSGCVSPATSSVDGSETTSAASAGKKGDADGATEGKSSDKEDSNDEPSDEDVKIQAKASSMVTVAPSSAGSLAKISSLMGGSDSEISISKVNGTWIDTTLIDGTEYPYVWVKDDNGAYYRVSFDTMDYAVVWDAEVDRGTVEYHRQLDEEYGRHVVVHLPEVELGHFDGKSSDTTGNDEQRISGSVADKLGDAAETDEEADDGVAMDKAANKE